MLLLLTVYGFFKALRDLNRREGREVGDSWSCVGLKPAGLPGGDLNLPGMWIAGGEGSQRQTPGWARKVHKQGD